MKGEREKRGGLRTTAAARTQRVQKFKGIQHLERRGYTAAAPLGWVSIPGYYSNRETVHRTLPV